MHKKVLLIGILLTVNISGLLSCHIPGTCYGVEPNRYCIEYTGCQLVPIDNRDSSTLSTNASIRYMYLSLELNFSKSEQTCHKTNTSIIGNTLYACSLEDEYSFNNPVINVEIYSDNEFNGQPTGANLAEYFSLNSTDELNSVNTYANAYLKLNSAPADGSIHSFTVKLRKLNKEELTATSMPVKILK